MSTLQERLRACAEEVQRHPHPSSCDHLHVAHDVLREVADRIDALEREVEALLFQLLAASNYIDALGGVSNSYRAAIDAARSKT